MSQELLYTSAPKGLKAGSRGFCTVLSSQGMPAPLATAVEALSGYRAIYPPTDERASRNPVVYSHLKMQAAGRQWHVLSRIADYGLDYSQRPNKLAHHVILDQQAEQLPGGPANLLAMPGLMREDWQGEPKLVSPKPITREPQVPSGVCQNWKDMAGDAGWAGVLAESFLNDPDRLVIVLFSPGQQILPLFAESIALLPVDQRWNVTFSTYFTNLATGTTCTWRAMIHDSKEAHESLRFVNALRIDLTADSLEPATGGHLVSAARTGRSSPTHEAPTFSSPRNQPRPQSAQSSIASSAEGYALRPPNLPSRSRPEINPSLLSTDDRLTVHNRPSGHSRWLLFGTTLSVVVLALVMVQSAFLTRRQQTERKKGLAQDQVHSPTEAPPVSQSADKHSSAKTIASAGRDSGATKDNLVDTHSNSGESKSTHANPENKPSTTTNPDSTTVSTDVVTESPSEARAINIAPQVVFRKLGEGKATPLHTFQWKNANTPTYARIHELSPSKRGSSSSKDLAAHQSADQSGLLNGFRAEFGELPPICRFYTPSWLTWTFKKSSRSSNPTLIDITISDKYPITIGTIDLIEKQRGSFEYSLKWKSNEQAPRLDWCAFEIEQPDKTPLSRIFFATPTNAADAGTQIKSNIKWSTHFAFSDEAIDSLHVESLMLEAPNGSQKKSFACATLGWKAASSNAPIRECLLKIEGLGEFMEESIACHPIDPVSPTLVLAARNEGDKLQLTIKSHHLFGDDGITESFERRLNRSRRELINVDHKRCEKIRMFIESVRDNLFNHKFNDTLRGQLEPTIEEFLRTDISTQSSDAHSTKSEKGDQETRLIHETEVKELKELEKKLREFPKAALALRNQFDSFSAIKSELDHIQLSEFKVSYDLNDTISDSDRPPIKALIIDFHQSKSEVGAAGKEGVQ